MRRVNPDTLEIEEVVKDPMKYLYIVTDDGCWDYERTHKLFVFKTFDKALECFEERAKMGRSDMLEWLDDPDDLEESKSVNRETETAYYDIWEDGDSERLNNIIRIEKVEVP